ncbi:MAG: hypothetical protein AB7I18_05745 [Candidatus Berkiella sp.]
MKDNHPEASASPLHHRSALYSLQEHPDQHSLRPFSILLNLYRTRARSELGERILMRGLHFYYLELVSQEPSLHYQLRANHDGSVKIPTGNYPYVILLNNGDYELRIGQMHHYYLANKSFEVIAAGEIFFEKDENECANIALFNDFSGGYHLEEEDELVTKVKRMSLENVYERVGLPLDKFQAVTAPATVETPKRRWSL